MSLIQYVTAATTKLSVSAAGVSLRVPLINVLRATSGYVKRVKWNLHEHSKRIVERCFVGVMITIPWVP